MLSHLRTIAFSGVERKLADHWGQVFTGPTPGLLMKEFRAGLRVEVVVPGLGKRKLLAPSPMREGLAFWSQPRPMSKPNSLVRAATG
jgi:hypothetical protein